MSKATKCTPSLTGMPHAQGDNTSPVERGVELLTIAKETMQRIRDELNEMRTELAPQIDGLEDPLQRTAMLMRYMDGYSVREIAYRLNYSEQHIFRVLAQAESKIAKT